MTELPDYNKITFTPSPPIPLEEILPDASAAALDLLRRFMIYRSRGRLPASKALLHSYFFAEPLPAHHSELPIPERTHKARHLLQHVHEYNIDAPLEDSLVPPAAIPPAPDSHPSTQPSSSAGSSASAAHN